MKLTSVLAFALAAVGTSASAIGQRQFCPEASRFGNLQVVPSDLQPGTWFTIHADFSCAVNYFGIVPRYTDFYIEVPSGNNGHEPPILVDRREFSLPAPPLSPALTFTAQFPYYPGLFEGAAYALALHTTYPINGTDGSEILVQGGVYAGLNVTS
ncbi:uncharacterized protein EV420DRAFT_691202 [Desarmillaria tabescens]|uniref:Uncharacterized protein n=1 Tax=Armillaria tabescens TaxID=1929756 RepID=A0AA39K4L4_ARMTA|nr:uncharacterized protein EV420DRAFT_691202 [Desarmillaria tabescens]KAK0452083.1 hypothetical protein EV420DRAFT_691202 [Desarmillaria tabescens]